MKGLTKKKRFVNILMAKTLAINTIVKASACFQNTLTTIENKYAITKEYITNKYTSIKRRMDTTAI